MDTKFLLSLLCFASVAIARSQSQDANEIEEGAVAGSYHQIEGKVYPPELSSDENFKNWIQDTEIVINSGEYKGFLKSDGSFVINRVPASSSFVVEVINPDYVYEPVRVEINSKGKYRARKVNYIQPSQIIQLPYPLKFKALTTFRYFQQREQWKVTDFLFSPMVLMMILPLILLVLLPKIMNDPEAKKEMENLQLPRFGSGGDLPDMSEMISKFLGGGAAAQQPQQRQQQQQSGDRSKNKRRNN